MVEAEVVEAEVEMRVVGAAGKGGGREGGGG